ncbi:MAG: CaiB/BaiF CoA-transferase family protein [Alphaproteobacteria bacterium]
MAAPAQPGPLDGLLVVAVEQAVAAPLCSNRLAAAGARVIKVERPEGDFARGYDRIVHGESAYFVWLNRGKQSAVLDLREPADLALLRRMIARADVLLQNLKPGALDRLGLGLDALRRAHPRLITCTITGYGESGPMAERKAYDLLIQAESGLASLTGGPEAPARVGVSVSDIATGMFAYEAILEALIRRGVTGTGAAIAVSMFDAMADWLTVPLLHAEHGAPPRRIGLSHPSIAPYGVFHARDGTPVLISIQNQREWRTLCADVLGRPAMADEPRYADGTARVANRAALDADVQQAFGALDAPALTARLDAAGIAFATVNDMAGLSRHPHLRRAAVDTPSGPVAMPAPPAIVDDNAAQPGPVPALGADTDRIRVEFAEDGDG